MLKVGNYQKLILAQGFILIVWIAIQLAMVISFHTLHLIIILIGLILMLIGWLLRTRAGSTELQKKPTKLNPGA
jgi:protein-S-isoprenylcysteine O-methyltransferase Ste14